MYKDGGNGQYRYHLLNLRSNTHGDYEITAAISQSLKNMMRYAPGWETLSEDKRESLDMIAVKLSRILSGNSNHADHWADIAGYAQLIAERLPHQS